MNEPYRPEARRHARALCAGIAALGSLAVPSLAQTTAPRPWRNSPVGDPDFFPLAVWLQDPVNAPRYAEIGINTYVGLWQGPTEKQLQTLARHKMRVICELNEVGRRNLDNPIIIGWMHGDEPDNAQSMKDHWKNDADAANREWPGTRPQTLEQWGEWGPPVHPSKIVRDYEALRRRDPTRPVFLNLGMGVAWDGWIGRGIRTNKPEDYPEYVKGADLVSFDIYPAIETHSDIAGKLELVPYGVRRLRKWTDDRKIVWNCIEASRIGNVHRKPTPAEVRAEVWMSIVAGSRGIVYFAHQFKPTFVEASLLEDRALADGVRAVNARIRELAPVLNSPTVEGAVTAKADPADAPVDTLVKRRGGALFLFAALPRNRGARVSFAVPELAGRRVRAVSLDENRAFEIEDGRFDDDFEAYGIRLYRIGD